MAERYVLDASALMCLIRDEPGADIVKNALPDSCISAVNLGEVVAKMNELGMSPSLIADVLDPLRLDARPFDEDQAYRSGLLRSTTRELGLSLGDRACLALAMTLDAVALTTDQVWSALGKQTRIKLAR